MTTPEHATLEEMYADIAGTHEIAQDLGVPMRRVQRWVDRRDSTQCPMPIVRLKHQAIYSKTEFRGWYAVWKVTRGHETWWMNSGDEASESGSSDTE